jgi:hypothetical protein
MIRQNLQYFPFQTSDFNHVQVVRVPGFYL